MPAFEQQQQDDFIRTLLNLPASKTTFTKSQRAYADVRKEIVTHSLPANTPLDESYLLSLFPVGRTPLREALKRLSHEGLLVWTPHQAPTVRDVSMHEMQYLYETRRMLEPTIAVLAARRATAEDHARIEIFRDAMVEASLSENVYRSVESDFALHAAIARATQNRFLAEASNALNLQSLRLWYRNQAVHGIRTIHESHVELVDTILSRDEPRSEVLANKHIQSSLQRQTTALREMSTLDAS
jgi:DNA-binding GntR family transcriptional regulator